VGYTVVVDRDAKDEVVLPDVKTRIFITSDSSQRHRQREQHEILQRKMRHFSLPANLSAEGKAALLVKCKNRIWEKCRDTTAPFSYSIDKRGKIELRLDSRGIVHGREEK
jgi:hypothetical protein